MKRNSVLAWTLAGCLAAFTQTAAAQEKLSVRLDFSPWGVQAAMHLAKDKGWFAAEGLDVDIQDGRGSGNTVQLTNAGQTDVGQVQVGLIGGARAQGAQLKSFFNFQRKTDLCILVDKDSPVSKVADLKGKTVVVFAASPWAPFIDLYLKSGGMDREQVKVEFVDPAALWGTYTAKRADGLMSTVGSALPVAEKPRPSKCLLASDAGIAFPAYGLVAREDTIKSRAAALKKLVKVQQRAWEHLRQNPDDGAKAIMAQRPDAKLNAEILVGQIKLTIDYFETPATAGKPIGWQAEADWDAALKSMEQAGVVKSGWKASDYYTNDLID
jgi:NitT/TauT family transport system substrate-binding protein